MNVSSIAPYRDYPNALASAPVFNSGAACVSGDPLLSAMPMALLLTDESGQCIDANQAALRLLALPHNGVPGRHIGEFLPDAVTPSWHDAPAFSSRATEVGEVRLRRESAAELRVALSVTMVPTAGSPVIAYFFRDITDEVATLARLHDAARTDPLTGLPNRMALEEALDRTLRSISRGAPSAALCFLDLDNFKAVNDSCGHAAGDAVLRQVADVLRQRARATDAIGRMGGDEFALVLQGCSFDDAELYTDALRQTIAALTISFSRRRFDVGLSAGTTVLAARTPSVAVALAEADRACYAAKSSGRAKTQGFTGRPLHEGQSQLEGLQS